MLHKALAVLALGAFASLATAQETLVIYFAKGFYAAEDKAVDELVDKFQKKTGVKVELSRYAPQEMIPRRSPRSTPVRRPTWSTATCSTSR